MLAPASLGDKVFLQKGPIRIIEDGMEIQVHGGHRSLHTRHLCSGMILPVHQRSRKGRLHLDRVLSRGRAFRDVY